MPTSPRRSQERLGVRPVLQPMNLDTLPGSSAVAEWDLAFPGRSLTPPELASLEASVPYYEWPVFVIVASTSPAASLTDLAGQRVCVVGGSAGADWLAGRLDCPDGGTHRQSAGIGDHGRADVGRRLPRVTRVR